MDYDFGGWATRNNLRCTDGRTILQNAFAECDGKTVPLVWNHKHDGANNVLGHCLLENRDDGVYCYGVFNDNPEGQGAKELVRHGDITGLSIYANGLKHVNGRNVQHGTIREVSLVLAGANPGAYIDDVICHGDDGSDDEACIFTGLDFDFALTHADENEKEGDTAMDTNEKETGKKRTVEEVFNELTDEQKDVVYALIGIAVEEAKKDDSVKHADGGDEKEDGVKMANDKTVEEVFNELTEEQKNVVYALIGIAVEEAQNGASKGDEKNMQHNVFDKYDEGDVLMHAQAEARDMFAEALADAKTYGSLKESVIAHGIEDIDLLFPEPKAWTDEPDFITRNLDWVKVVMDGVHKVPFTRIKSWFADLTEEEARAKGYIKGNLKKEQVFSLLKRTTIPTTVYKKQKLNRDDIADITDFDVVRWIRKEMDFMLREEIARALLIGDGRDPSSDDKVDASAIRPIWTDDDFFTIKYDLGDASGRAFIEGAVRSRSEYKGSGNPVAFMTEQKLTDLLLLTDAVGRDLYDSVDKLATKLRVAKIITVPVMEKCVRVDKSKNKAWALQGLIVNLNDYVVGTDKGGEVRTFDQFDIDYNAQKYLIETRCSGSLVKPFSAIALETETDMPEENDG